MNLLLEKTEIDRQQGAEQAECKTNAALRCVPSQRGQ